MEQVIHESQHSRRRWKELYVRPASPHISLNARPAPCLSRENSPAAATGSHACLPIDCSQIPRTALGGTLPSMQATLPRSSADANTALSQLHSAHLLSESSQRAMQCGVRSSRAADPVEILSNEVHLALAAKRLMPSHAGSTWPEHISLQQQIWLIHGSYITAQRG